MRALTVSTRRSASLFYGAVRVRSALRQMRVDLNSAHLRRDLQGPRLVLCGVLASVRLGPEAGTPMLVED